MGEPGGGGEERWEKIGIAPHQQTLNIYYFNKYINFFIKLFHWEISIKKHITYDIKTDVNW